MQVSINSKRKQSERENKMTVCLGGLSVQRFIMVALLLSLLLSYFISRLRLMNQVFLPFQPEISDVGLPQRIPDMLVIEDDKANSNIIGAGQRYKNCPFKDSSIVESIYVYPHPGSPEWKGDILSDFARQAMNNNTNVTIDEYPWIANDLRCKTNGNGAYETTSQLVQYNTELLVRDIITHPDSCLRTNDPEKATLFYVPYLPSAEFHNGSVFMPNKPPTAYGSAIQDIITKKKYEQWEKVFGLTSKYWKRREGSDHILVFSEPMHGLWHPSNRRGNFHFLHSQFQTHAPIVISNELSKTFIDMYPMCAKKNVLMPYPNTDGRWFNGVLDQEAAVMIKETLNISKLSDSPAAIQSELELVDTNPQKGQEPSQTTTSATTVSPLRILGYFYSGGNHGTCRKLRRNMKDEFQCTKSGKMVAKYKLKSYGHAYRQATFCPCPGGDSPSAKRNFDVLFAGCIPVVISEDFVWPFTEEFDRSSKNHTNGKGGVALLNPDDFSIRLRAEDHEISKFDSPKTCVPISTENDVGNQGNSSLQSVLEAISSEELARLRKGAALAAYTYSYYKNRPDLPDNPLQAEILPDGGAAHALVKALEERAAGALWGACQKEMEGIDRNKDNVRKFKC